MTTGTDNLGIGTSTPDVKFTSSYSTIFIYPGLRPAHALYIYIIANFLEFMKQ